MVKDNISEILRSRGGETEKHTPLTHPPTFVSLGTTARNVLDLLVHGKTLHAISRELGVDRGTVKYHVKRMKEFGFTYFLNSIWHVTPEAKGYLRGGNDFVVSERGGGRITDWLRHDRAHNIKIKVVVAERPGDDAWLRGWDSNAKMKNNVFYTRRFGEIVTMFTGRSMVFQLPPLHFEDDDLALAEAGKIAMALMDKYEREVCGLKLGEYSVTAQLITQHHALPYDPFAKWCVAHGITFKGEHFEADASDTPEIEFPTKDGFRRYTEYVDDFVGHDVLKPSEVTSEIRRLRLEGERRDVVLDETKAVLLRAVKNNEATTDNLLVLAEFMRSQLPRKVVESVDVPNERVDYVG